MKGKQIFWIMDGMEGLGWLKRREIDGTGDMGGKVFVG